MTARPPQYEDGHPPGSPERLEAWKRRYPHRVRMSPEAQRQSAQQDVAAAMHAQRRGETCPTPSCTWPRTEHRHDPDQPVYPPLWRNL